MLLYHHYDRPEALYITSSPSLMPSNCLASNFRHPVPKPLLCSLQFSTVFFLLFLTVGCKVGGPRGGRGGELEKGLASGS